MKCKKFIRENANRTTAIIYKYLTNFLQNIKINKIRKKR